MSRSDVLVDADWVEAHLDDPSIVLVEVDEDTTAYEKGHITGAVRIDWRDDLQDPVRRDFVNKEQFEALLSAQGHRQRPHRRPLRRQQQLVRRLRLLVLQALRPRRRPPARRRPQAVGARLPHAGGRRAGPPGDVLHRQGAGQVDPRVPRRGPRRDRLAQPRRRPFARRVRRPAARAGAPAAGAVAAGRPHPDRAQHPVVQGGQRRRHLPSRRRADRRSTPRRASTCRKDTIAYCRIGERSAHTWFVLHELLGQPNVRNYDGSWTEYGSLVGVPVQLGDEAGSPEGGGA